MPMSATFSSLIINDSIFNGVLSYYGSKKFIERLIPTAVGLILYHRTDIDRSNFKERDYNGFRYTTFKRKVSNEVLKQTSYCCKGALDAFKREYLKELYLLFLDTNDSFDIIESYKFQVEYGNHKISPTLVHQESLKTAVGDLFRSISKINVEPLKEAEFTAYICLTYNDKVPLDYEPPYIEQYSGDNEIIHHIINQCRKYVNLGQTNTGFHSISYECDIPGWNPSSSSTDVEDDISMQEMDKIKQIDSSKRDTVDNSRLPQQLEEDVIYFSTTISTDTVSTIMDVSVKKETLEKASNDSTETDGVCGISDTEFSGSIYDFINCGCLLNKKFFNIEFVKCSRCQFMQHLPCLGFLFNSEINYNVHVCNDCNNGEFNNYQHILYCFRLLLAHTFFNQSFAYEVFKNLEHGVKINLIKILKIHNAIRFVKNKYVVIPNEIDALVEKVFSTNGKVTSLEELELKF